MFLSRYLGKHENCAKLLLRLAVAAAFIYHGQMKWGMFTAAPEGMSSTMLFIMKALAICEPLAGVAMILGLLTEVAALGFIVVMVSAIFNKVSGGGVTFGKIELDFILLCINLAILILGPGKYSLDAMMRRK